MQTTFKHYARRDGSVMLYINRSNGGSIGISADRDFSPYGKGSTQGMRNVYDAACRVIKIFGRPFTGDLSKHTETGFSAPVLLANGWTIVGTDVANIGGMDVGEDGGFLIANGLIVKMGRPLDENEAE